MMLSPGFCDGQDGTRTPERKQVWIMPCTSGDRDQWELQDRDQWELQDGTCRGLSLSPEEKNERTPTGLCLKQLVGLVSETGCLWEDMFRRKILFWPN